MVSKRRNVLAAAAAAVALGGAGTASAALAKLEILGRVQGSGNPFASSFTVAAGNTVEYQVVASIIQGGTQGTRTVTSISATPGVDGMNSYRFDIFQPDAPSATDIGVSFGSAGTMSANGQGPLFNVGTLKAGPTSSEPWIDAVRPVATSTTANIHNAVFYTGTFTVSTAASGQQAIIAPRYDAPSGTGAVRINGGVNTAVTTTIENSTDPVFSFFGMTLNGPAAPPPAIIAQIEDLDPGVGAGTNFGTANVAGSDGSYVPVNVATSNATKGVVGFTGIPSPDDVWILLDLQDDTELNALVAALTAGGYNTGENPSFIVDTTDPQIGFIGAALGKDYDVALKYVNRAGAGTDYFQFDFSNIAGANGGAVEIANVGVVPEPASVGVLALGALGVLGRRRRQA